MSSKAVSSKSAARQQVLFDQFSQILDKIAASLSEQTPERPENAAFHAAPEAKQNAAPNSAVVKSQSNEDLHSPTTAPAQADASDKPAAADSKQDDNSKQATESDSDEQQADESGDDTQQAAETASSDVAAQAPAVSTAAAQTAATTAAAKGEQEQAEAQVEGDETDLPAQSFADEQAAPVQAAPQSQAAAPAQSDAAATNQQGSARQQTGSQQGSAEQQAVEGDAAQAQVQGAPAAQATTKPVAELPEAQHVESQNAAVTQTGAAAAPTAADFSAQLKTMLTAEISAMASNPLRASQDAAAQMVKHAVEGSVLQAAHEAKSVGQTFAPQGFDTAALKTQNSAFRSEESRPVKSVVQVNQTAAMEKVESALKEAARSRDGKTISVRLDPPDLGTVKVDVSLREGNLHARLVAETPQVTQVLRDKAYELQAMLRKLGLAVDTVSVAVRGQNEHAAQENSAGSRQQQQRRASQGGSEQAVSAGAAAMAVGAEQAAAVASIDGWVA